MTGPRMIKSRGDGLRIQAAFWEGNSKPVLSIHGLTANGRCWDLIASALIPNHPVIAPDLRGRGFSESPSSGYSIEHHVRDIIALMDDLHLECPVVMGHSLGAFITLALAAAYPQRVDRIILIDGGGDLSDRQRERVQLGIKPSLDRLGKIFPDFETYVSTQKQISFYQPWNSCLEAYFQYDIHEVEEGVVSRVKKENIQEEILNFKHFSSSLLYPKIGSPALVLRATQGMVGKDDLLLPEEVVDRMVREIPSVQRVDLEGTNHYSILFQPNKKRDQAILRFLDS